MPLGSLARFFLARQVRPGYPTKADPTGSWYSLPYVQYTVIMLNMKIESGNLSQIIQVGPAPWFQRASIPYSLSYPPNKMILNQLRYHWAQILLRYYEWRSDIKNTSGFRNGICGFKGRFWLFWIFRLNFGSGVRPALTERDGGSIVKADGHPSGPPFSVHRPQPGWHIPIRRLVSGYTSTGQ